ncbi:MAG: NAD(P)-dependent oxidoreductase [Chitinophagales bacterium]
MFQNTDTVIVLFFWLPDEKLQKKLKEGLASAKNLKLLFPPNSKEKKIVQQFCEKNAHKAHIMIGWRPKREWLWAAKDLQLYINPGTGVRGLIPLFKELNQERSVTLINGHGHAHLTAQHTIALLLALTNRIVSHHQWMKEGIWRTGDENSTSIPLYNRKIGLLGYGAINQRVHQLLTPFNTDVSILKRSWKENESYLDHDLMVKAQKFDSNQLHDFLQYIDTLILAVPHTAKTEGMIGAEELKLLGEQGLLVNVARGIVVEEKALFDALQNKTIAGAALDVWYNYRPETDAEGRQYPYEHPFHDLDNIVLSPHRAGSPFSELARWDELINNVLLFAEGKRNWKSIVSLEHGY